MERESRMYYGWIILSVVMFGGGFALQNGYRKLRGSGLRISLEASLVGSLAGLLVLLIFNRFHLALTPFTLLIAALASANGIAFTFCSFKALDTINLSLFSLFSMLGGMVLPFLQGIIFYGEALTGAKLICLGLICAALLLTVTRGERRGGTVYYVAIFVLNGMSGVLSKLFASASFDKTDGTSYSIWIAICTALLSGILLLCYARGQKEPKPYTARAFATAATQGAVNRIANLLLVIALAHVDASVQYPMVTGGVMIVSTLICFFGEKKPTRKELASVALAFLGMLALFAIPI